MCLSARRAMRMVTERIVGNLAQLRSIKARDATAHINSYRHPSLLSIAPVEDAKLKWRQHRGRRRRSHGDELSRRGSNFASPCNGRDEAGFFAAVREAADVG